MVKARLYGRIKPTVKELLQSNTHVYRHGIVFQLDGGGLEERLIAVTNQHLLVCKRKSEAKYTLKLKLPLKTTLLRTDVEELVGLVHKVKSLQCANVFALEQVRARKWDSSYLPPHERVRDSASFCWLFLSMRFCHLDGKSRTLVHVVWYYFY